MSDAPNPDSDISTDRPEDLVCCSVLVGHAIASLDDEAAVALSVNQQRVRLSPDGARLVAQQLTAWADHAEKRNAARPVRDVHKMLYRVMPRSEDRQWQAVDKAAEAEPAPVVEVRRATPEEETILAPVVEILQRAKRRGKKTTKRKPRK